MGRMKYSIKSFKDTGLHLTTAIILLQNVSKEQIVFIVHRNNLRRSFTVVRGNFTEFFFTSKQNITRASEIRKF